ncbi:MAG: ParA family protein [Saprospiraceae bacterium]|nr:ParA family protein [Saprospiraceae bacterium]
MSQIITFYSYKGGVGRSMALANVATLLSKWGKRVLMIDWDLEAPGLENFFLQEGLTDTDWSKQKGILEWLVAKRDKTEANWQDWVVPFKTSVSKTDLHLLVSGKSNGDYSEKLRDFNVTKFYEEHDGGHIIENLREELLAAYDYVLIDSRTGVTDFGGICTIQLPDILVMLFTPTEQALLGTEKIARRILDSHKKLPFDRFRLQIFPVPSRFDSTTEFQESRRWLTRIAEKLEWLYEDWLPADINLNEFLQIIKIPYISYFSFGEKLPVIEQGVSDPAGLGYAYENLAVLLTGGLTEIDKFMHDRDYYLMVNLGETNHATLVDRESKDKATWLKAILKSTDPRQQLYFLSKALELFSDDEIGHDELSRLYEKFDTLYKNPIDNELAKRLSKIDIQNSVTQILVSVLLNDFSLQKTKSDS